MTSQLKTQVNIRISDHTKQQIAALMTKMGTTQTEVITIAIDRMAREKTKDMDPGTRGTAYTD